VRIRNRETLVIGGLRQKNSIHARSGIPYLMDFHWPIGEFFKQKDVTARDSELVVFITPELLDLNYQGLCREHDIYNAAMPTLDCISAPALPLPPCPLEDWKHRCGCKKCKKGGHDGPCQACQPGRPNGGYPPPAYPVEQLPPGVPTFDPDQRMIEPRDSNAPRIPLVEDPPGQQTRSPRLRPVHVESAAKKSGSQALIADNAEPARATPPTVLQTRRLPALSDEPAYMAERLTPRDIFKPLPPVEENKLR
jgi:hypothetical protein